MWEGTDSVVIAAQPEKVWDIITDVERHLELHGSGEIKAIRMSGPLRVGATWEADEQIKGAGKFTARSEVIELQPNKVFSWKSYPPPIKKGNPNSVPDVQWWFRVEPAGEGTRLSETFRVVEPKAGGGMMKVFYAIMRREKTIKRGMHRTLQQIKAAAEA